MTKFVIPFLLGLAAFSSISCTAPAPATKFVEAAPKMARDKSTTFQRSWMKPGVSFQRYDKVYLTPSNIDYAKVKGTTLHSRRLVNGGYQKDILKEGAVLRNEFAKAFRRSKNRNWTVLKTPTRDRRALKVETALVETAPSRVELEAAGYVVPGVSLLNSVSVATEVKISDARSGELLAVFADRQKSPFSPIDLSKLTYYKASRNIMRDWGRQTVKWIERKGPEEQIYESLPFLPVAF